MISRYPSARPSRVRTLSILLLAFLLMFLSGCSPQPEKRDAGAMFPEQSTSQEVSSDSKTPLKIIHDGELRATDYLGNEVILTRPPERIIIAGKSTLIAADAVALFPQAAEHITALGLTNQGMGDFYQILTPTLRLGDRLPHTVPAEEIASLQPDIVFIKERSFIPLGEKLSSLNIPVFALYLEEPESYSREIRELGKILGDTERADTIVDYFDSSLRRIEEAADASGTRAKKRVLLVNASTQDGNLMFSVPPLNWIQTSMVQLAGGIPVWEDADLSSSWTKVNFEQIAMWDPEVLLVVNYKAPAIDLVQTILSDPTWQDLQCIQEGSVYAFPSDYHSWGQPDTRWILGLLWLYDTLSDHADNDFSMEDEIKGFYRFLYGVEDPSILAQIIEMYHDSIGR